MSLEGFKECQYFNPSISCEYWYPGEGCWDLEGRCYILFSLNVWVEILPSATALLLFKLSSNSNSGGAAGHEAGLAPSVWHPLCWDELRLSSLHTWQRPACTGMSLGWGWDVMNKLFVFSCQWDLVGVLN